MDKEWTFGLEYEGEPCGKARVCQKGLYMTVDCDCSPVTDQVVRVYLPTEVAWASLPRRTGGSVSNGNSRPRVVQNRPSERRLYHRPASSGVPGPAAPAGSKLPARSPKKRAACRLWRFPGRPENLLPGCLLPSAVPPERLGKSNI